VEVESAEVSPALDAIRSANSMSPPFITAKGCDYLKKGCLTQKRSLAPDETGFHAIFKMFNTLDICTIKCTVIAMRLLEKLVDSKSKIAVLSMLLERSGPFSVSDLSRLCSVPKSTVSLIVKDWEESGLASTQTHGRNKIVQINSRFYLLPELQGMFSKASRYNEHLIGRARSAKVISSRKIRAAIAFGSRARDEGNHFSDIDVLLITKNKEKSIVDKAHSEFNGLSETTGITYSPAMMGEKEFHERIAENDRFIMNVLRDGVVLKGGEWIGHAQAAP